MKNSLTMEAVMTPCPHTVEAELSLSDALQLMHLRKIRQLPVAQGGELIGVLSRREAELMQAVSDQASAMPKAGDICSREPYIVSVSDPVREVTKEMADQKLTCALVVDDEERVAGIFTTADACRLIHLILSDKEAAE